MKQIILIILSLLSLQVYCQRKTAKRSSGSISIQDFVGTWKLTRLADKHLTYQPDAVQKEILRFTKDSVFVTVENGEYSGKWQLVGSQPVITIKETNKYNYTWLAGTINEKFFTTKGLGYYKYFVRINKY